MKLDIYDGKDAREVPVYTVPTAASYLRMSPQTLRTWVAGYSYKRRDGSTARQPRVIEPAAIIKGQPFLSFLNLVEAHVLCSIRRVEEIPLPRVRKALRFISEKFGTAHPLAYETFATDGVDLFVEKFGTLVNVSAEGQTSIREAIRQSLRRVEYGERHLAQRLFPVIRATTADDRIDRLPKIVVIDPKLAFGKPVVDGTGVPVSEIAQRFRAGDSVEHLAEEFRVSADKVQEALRAAA